MRAGVMWATEMLSVAGSVAESAAVRREVNRVPMSDAPSTEPISLKKL